VSSPYAQKGSSSGSVYAQKGSRTGSVYAGKGGTPSAKKHHGGFMHALAKYSGAQLAGNLAKDIGRTAVGVGPGIYHVGKTEAEMLGQSIRHPIVSGKNDPNYVGNTKAGKAGQKLLDDTVKGYKDYYGHDVGHHIYSHPLQPILDALTVADIGATAGVKLGALSGERAALVTRSPRAIATGKGPRHIDISSTKPTVRGREVLAQKLRRHPKIVERRGGEVARYGKQIQAEATHHALGNLTAYTPYFKATKGLSANEWSALHIRARDAHPEDLAKLWGDSPAGRIAANPKVQKLALHPTKKLLRAEQEARRLSESAGKFSIEHGMLTEESAAARPELLQRLAAGERYVAPTPARQGFATPALKRTRQRVVSLEGRVERSQRGRFNTVEQAQARLATLERQHNEALDKIAGRMFGPVDPGEVRFRNIENARARRQSSGLTRAGKSSGASGRASRTRATVTDQMRAEAEKLIEKQVAANPNHPVMRAWAERTAEIDRLQSALNPELFTKVNRRTLGNVGAPTDPARHAQLEGALAVAGRDLVSAEKAAAKRVTPTGLVPGQAPGIELRPIHGKPYYVPDTMEPVKAGTPLGATGGGKAAPKTLGTSKQNTGALALSGKLHLRGDVLGPEFLRRVKKVKYDEIHNALRRGAVRITPDELRTHYDGKLPKGWEFLRVKAHQGIGPAEEPSPPIRPTMRGEVEQHVPISKLIPNPEDLHGSQLAEGFSTTDPQAAHVTNGRYYIVPKRMVKAATGEFTRSSDFTRTFIRQPLKVWRSLVLGLRVGFLTNNLVGNSVMYAVKTGGQGALRDLFMAIRESHGDRVAKQVLDNAATPPAVRQSLYQEFFPEQMHGTFGQTQSPAASRLTEAAGGVGRGFNTVTGAIPKLTSAVAETGFRKALIRHYIRHSPEFRTVYRQLPKQTRTFEDAARQLMEGKAGKAYQRNISKQVNNALGDYLNMSATERNVLRNAIPFYSWYRAITVTTFHLAADTPLRANILGQLGQIGRQWSDQQLGDIPSFLEGAIPLGNGAQGTQRVLATQGLNPYATLEQLRRGSAEDVTSLGLNPFLTAAADAYAKKKYNGGIGPAQLAGSTLQAMLLGLPPSRLIAPPAGSKLYPTRNRRTQELGYLGIPIKEYSRAEAARQKAQGR
jgi:hypothetical protein